MLLIEENHVDASTSTHTDSKMLYTEGDWLRGRGGRGESVLSKVRSFPNCYVYTGEYAVLSQPIVDAPYRGEPRGCVNEHAHR